MNGNVNEFLMQAAATESGPGFRAKHYLAIIELAESKMIGWMEDPNEQLNAEGKIRIRFPLEYKDFGVVSQNNKHAQHVGFFRPEYGIPEEFVTDFSEAMVISLSSPFANLYLGALSNVLKEPLSYQPTIITRPAVKPQAQK